MAYQKLQAYRALDVIPSNTIDIPNPAMLSVSSNTTSNAPGKLIDTSQDFTTNGVKIGDIVYEGVNVGTVIAIDSATQLSVGMAVTSPAAYTIYNASDAPNNGCVLYSGAAQDIEVLTVGGDRVIFKGIQAGSFIPVQVLRVATKGSPTDIIALW
tara:strand:- start:1844 stop:2308 length:465 start_codon:yes stop_codon:yes gene_type:complete